VALAIAEGADPKAIQVRMGHSSINVTLDRYGHLFPELDEAIAAGLGERLAAVRRLRHAG
jgi:integrase